MESVNRPSAESLSPLSSAARSGSASPLLSVVTVIAVWCVILFSFRAQVALVLEAWETLPSHAHGYVVLLVVAYLLWTKRAAFPGVSCTPSWTGLALLMATGLVAFLGDVVAVAAVVQFAIVFMMIFSVWAVMGDRAFRLVRGPLSFLIFAVPFGHEVLPVLMNWTADATVAALRQSGVPVFQEGRNFVIPSGRWSVIEACGGIRYLLTSVFIGAVFAYITYTHTYKRVLFMIWSVIMPLIANWVRAYTIVMVAHLTENEWGLGMSHLTLGWVIFGVAVFVSFAVGTRWADPLPTVQPSARGASAPAMTTLLVGVAAAAIPVGWHLFGAWMEAQELRKEPVVQLASLATLERGDSTQDGVRPLFPGARVRYQATYLYKGNQIDVYVGYYRNQRQGAELVSVGNSYEPTKDWSWSLSAQSSDTHPGLPGMKLEGYLKAGRHAALHHLYWVNGMTTTNDAISKLLELGSRLRGRGDDAAAIAITAYSHENLDVARKLSEDFAAQFLPGILADLERAAVDDAPEAKR